MKNKNSYEVLEAEVAKLKEENRHLKDERDELKYMLNDMHSVVDAANDDFFNEMSRLCGCIEIEGTRITAAYQDLVGILLANGYTVEVTPLHNNTRLQVVRSTISSILNSIKSTFTSVWNSIKSTVSNVINGVKSTISSGLNAAKSTVSNILGAIKEKFSSIFEGAKNIVSNAINRIKSFFNFSWSLPHLKLPHISISGSFSLTPPSVPHFGIDWYKKAMDDGMIMNQPTIFGYNAKSNQFLAGGEAGSETVVGTQSLMDMIRVAVNEENASLLEKLDRILTILESYMPFIPQLANLKLVTDTGVLAGELAPAMDEELGKIFDKEGRR